MDKIECLMVKVVLSWTIVVHVEIIELKIGEPFAHVGTSEEIERHVRVEDQYSPPCHRDSLVWIWKGKIFLTS